NAGTAVVWSAVETDFAGSVIGTGGSSGGNGGFAEVSGHDLLNFTGTVSLLGAAGGTTGTLLLDPANVTISTSATSNDTLSSGTYSPTSGAATSNILNTDLQAALSGGNITITTTNSGTSGGSAGTITVSAAVTWASGSSLTLNAASTITDNASITSTSTTSAGNITLTAGSGSGISFGSGVTLSTAGPNGTITLTGTSLTGTPTMQAIGSGGAVIVQSSTATTAMSLNGTSALNVSQAFLNNVAATTFTLGNTTSTGAIAVGASGAVTVPSTITNLRLMTNATSPGITFSNSLTNTNTGGSLLLEANGVSIPNAVNEISTGSGNGTITIEPVGTAATTITLKSGAGAAGMTFGLTGTNNLNSITTGTLILGSTSDTGTIVTGTGTVTLPSTITNLELITNNATTGAITLATALRDTNSGATILLEANGFSITSAASELSTGTGTGTVIIEPVGTSATNITLKSGAGAAGVTFGLTGTNSLGSITTGTLIIGSTSDTGTIATTTGTVTLPSTITNLQLITNNATTSAITLTTAL